MGQLRDGLSFRKEDVFIFLIKRGMENFDSRIVFQVEVLSQIDFCEGPFPQETVEMIVSDALSFTL